MCIAIRLGITDFEIECILQHVLGHVLHGDFNKYGFHDSP